jgi:transcription elongation factor Elf1
MVQRKGAPVSDEPAHWTCPVCGFAALVEPPLDPTGSPTYSICPCCGTQFGADDLAKPHDELRKEWIDAGAEWWSQNEPAPPKWDANEQLKAAGFADGGPRN